MSVVSWSVFHYHRSRRQSYQLARRDRHPRLIQSLHPRGHLALVLVL
jgi:hypothetical protein